MRRVSSGNTTDAGRVRNELFEEGKELEEKEIAFEIARNGLNLKNQEQDIQLRKKFSTSIFVYLICWSGFVALFLTLAALNSLRASDPVLIALITTSLTQVIAIFLIVVNYIFPRPG